MSPDQTIQLFTLNLTQHDRLSRSRHGSLHAVRSVIIASLEIASLEMRLRASLQNPLLTSKAWTHWVRHFRRSEVVATLIDDLPGDVTLTVEGGHDRSLQRQHFQQPAVISLDFASVAICARTRR